MSIRPILLASAALVGMVGQAHAQSAANVSGVSLLLPFTTLNSTDAGRGALADNLASTIAVNNGASAARQQQALSDNNIIYNGQQFTNGLGTTLDAAYQAAVNAHDSRVTKVQADITAFTNYSGSDSAFGKFYFANGTTNGTTPASGPALPPGGQFNTYDTAYGVSPTTPGQNVYGDSRPFQTRPDQIKVVSATVNASLTNSSAFPSGHTTFGSTVAILEAMAVPERFSQEIARGLDYGYSRVVLGVHYSLDTIAGRILGLHAVADALNGTSGYGNAATNQAAFADLQSTLRSTLSSYSTGSKDVAVAAGQDNGQFSAANTAQVTADAEYRNDYGIRATGPTNLAPVVPDGAEVLLATRYPYLTAAQRRDVLASTELPSGFALDDGSGWARLDLYRAGLGYAAFTAMTQISQNAVLGGLNAADTFSNAIGGAGGLTHSGTGTLTLSGANTYSGGTIVNGGTLVAANATALGSGNVLVEGGTLQVNGTLSVGGTYTQTAAGVLTLTEAGRTPALDIAGLASLDGVLNLDLGTYGSSAGLFEVIGYGDHSGAFSSVNFAGLGGGFGAQLDYEANGLFVRLTGGVPEPATWATMIAGFGLVGGALRRRRASLAAA